VIVKSMSRKEASFGQLLQYINKPKNKGKTAVLYNFQDFSDNVQQIETEFLENYEYAPKRKNGNALYHEIISFSEKDGKLLTEEVLHDLVFEYLEKRAVGALCYAKAHFDKKNPHVHIVISANFIKSPQKLRITKGQFQTIKRELEKYQKRRYPFLENSIVFEGREKKEKLKTTIKEGERERRNGKQQEESRKEQIVDIVKNCLCVGSEKDFAEKLKAAGLKFYVRGKTVGVQEAQKGRKFRLQTLGVVSLYLAAQKRWENVNKRQIEIRQIEMEKERQKWREFDFHGEVLGVIEEKRESGKRAEEIRRILRAKAKCRRERGL
jgi:hypothetical protein